MKVPVEGPKGPESPGPEGREDPMLRFFKGMLEPEAYSRVLNLYMMAKGGDKRKASLLQALFQYLQRLVGAGYVRRKITEGELVSLLERISSSERKGSIKIIRK